MQIGCTKKLLDYLGCDTVEYDASAAPIFNFTANLITINRRKCIAVVNDASRCGFVIYGVTAKEKKSIASLILKGIEAMLKSERYSDKAISRYLDGCGDVLFYQDRRQSSDYTDEHVLQKGRVVLRAI